MDDRHEKYIDFLVNNIDTMYDKGRWFLVTGSFILADFSNEQGAKDSLEKNFEMYEHIIMTQLDDKFYTI